MRFSWIFRTILTYVGYLYVLPGSSGGGGGSAGDGDGPYFNCPHCDKTYSSRSGRNKHIKRIHQAVRVRCRHSCGKTYVENCASLKHHERTCDANPAHIAVGRGINQQHFQHTTQSRQMGQIQTAHEGNFRLFRKNLNVSRNIMENVRNVILHDVRGVLRRQTKNVKYYVTAKFIFEKPHRPGVFTDPPIYFSSDPIATTSSKPIQENLDVIYREIVEKVETFQQNGSGWVLRQVVDVDLRVLTYDPTRANSYLRLPKKLQNSHSILNIKNDDDKCALWCILAHLYPEHDRNDRTSRVSDPEVYRKHEYKIKTGGVKFPLEFNDIGKLERFNDLSINVFSIDSFSNLFPIRISEQKVSPGNVIDLLYVVDGENSHYCLITNIAGLLRAQSPNVSNAAFLCRRCLHFSWREDAFKNHLERCARHVPQRTVFPKAGDKKGRDKVRFTNVERQLPLPFYFVADFECILEKVDMCLPDDSKSSTNILQKHVPCGAAYKISCTDSRFYRDPVIITHDNSGKSVAERFLDSILSDAREIREMLRYKTPMLPLSDDEQLAFDSANVNCSICKKAIGNDQVKVRDHCHLTGKYRGPAHQDCNLNYRINPDKVQIPCFFHNLKNYDGHHLISAAKKHHGDIVVIPSTTEKYISFTIGDVVFKDSLAFTQASLDDLVKNLECDQLLSMRQWLESKIKIDDDDDDDDDSVVVDDEPTDYDMTFIDDRPGCSKRRYAFDDKSVDDGDDFNAIDDNDDIPHKRRYFFQSSDDDDGDGDDDVMVSQPSLERFRVDCDDDDDVVVGGDDDDDGIDVYDADYGLVMHHFDYRLSPYSRPDLDESTLLSIETDFNFLKRKGVYPYEYMESFDKLKEEQLPPIEAFKSSLRAGETISEEDYDHAKAVFQHFEMKSLQDYHNLYLLQDVLLLDDVLTAFRKVCLETYGLDPMHYYTAPGLTWDAGLKYTGITLDLLTDEEMFLFVEDGLRGGISMISHRYAKANHPDLEELGYFDRAKPILQMLYLDANNLYGWAMSQFLPVSDFRWMHSSILTGLTLDWIQSIAWDSEDEYIFEVDMKPLNLDMFSDYPLAPERKSVNGLQLSPFQRRLLRMQFELENEGRNDEGQKRKWTAEEIEAKIDAYVSAEKLIPDMHEKKKYILHYRNLQLYLKLGWEITRIHRVLCFKQKAWLEPYIRANTLKRQDARSEFEKDFFKLMNNAFFGKTMENVRKRRNVDIVTCPEKMKKLVAQPTFKSEIKFTEDLTAIERIKGTVHMNKPIYIGMCVLELSKFLMYDFYYNTLKKLFPRVRLLFTDTDSLCVCIEGSNDVYKDIHEGIVSLEDGSTVETKNFFDFSNYPPDHLCFSNQFKKVPGKMKDELGANLLLEFVGLRPKAYAFTQLSLVKEDTKDSNKKFEIADVKRLKGSDKKFLITEVKKLKGIQKCVVKRNISFDHYKSCLLNEETHLATNVSFQSRLHQVSTMRVRKVAMTPYDDKRYLLEDGIESLPYGYDLFR